eukprot:4799457-Heterocapsa_arctica.AAC.1
MATGQNCVVSHGTNKSIGVPVLSRIYRCTGGPPNKRTNKGLVLTRCQILIFRVTRLIIDSMSYP